MATTFSHENAVILTKVLEKLAALHTETGSSV